MDNNEKPNEKPQDKNQASSEYIPSSVVVEKASIVVGSKWLRLLFMILFVFCHYIVRVIIYLLAIIQFIMVLVTGKPHEGLLKLGQSFSYYAYQILRFLTYNTEEKPFPFTPWPQDRV